MGIVPAISCTASEPASAMESRRRSIPGNSIPDAMRRPAAPESMIAGSSSEPCAAMKLHIFSAMRCWPHATATTPSITPLKNSDHSVHSPNVTPPAKVMKQTVMLLVMIPVDACGFAVRMRSVHILWCSISSIICGLMKECWKSGRRVAISAPSNAPKMKSAVAMLTYLPSRRRSRG